MQNICLWYAVNSKYFVFTLVCVPVLRLEVRGRLQMNFRVYVGGMGSKREGNLTTEGTAMPFGRGQAVARPGFLHRGLLT